jgi:hypothetical protein
LRDQGEGQLLADGNLARRLGCKARTGEIDRCRAPRRRLQRWRGGECGENGGRKVRYTNVLRAETKLADWRGGTASVAIAPAQLKVKGADRYALVLRVPGGGTVLAARWLA